MSDGVFSYPIISNNILPTWPFPEALGWRVRGVASQIPPTMLLWDFKTLTEELDFDLRKSHFTQGVCLLFWLSIILYNLHCNRWSMWNKRYLAFTILINVSSTIVLQAQPTQTFHLKLEIFFFLIFYLFIFLKKFYLFIFFKIYLFIYFFFWFAKMI